MTAPGPGGPASFELDKPVKIGIFSVRNAMEQARHVGDKTAAERMSDQETGFVKKIWYSEFDRTYRYNDTVRALEEMRQSGNLFAGEDGDIDSDSSRLALMERMMHDEVFEHTRSAGETSEIMANDSELKTRVWELIEQSLANGVDKANFEEEAKALIMEMSAGNPDMFGEGLLMMSNLWEAKKTVEYAISQGDSLDRIKDESLVYVGEANAGVRAETHRDAVDRLIDKIDTKHRQQVLVSKDVVEASLQSVAIAGSAAALGTGAKVGLKAAGFIPGIAIGINAAKGAHDAIREADINRARAIRERAQGKEAELTEADIEAMSRKGIKNKLARRRAAKQLRNREAIEATLYETVDANELSAQLEALVDDNGEIINVDDVLDFSDAMELLARVSAYDRFSNDPDGSELFTYSHITKVEEERFRLSMARYEYAIALRSKLPDIIGSVPPDYIPTDPMDEEQKLDETFNNILAEMRAVFTESINADVAEKDAQFAALKKKMAVKSALTRAAMSAAAIGAVTFVVNNGFELVKSAANYVKDKVDDKFTGEFAASDAGYSIGFEAPNGDIAAEQIDSAVTETAEITNEQAIQPIIGIDHETIYSLNPPVEGTSLTPVSLSDSLSLNLPDGMDYSVSEINGERVVSVSGSVDGYNLDVASFTIDANGNIDPESARALTDLGVVVEQSFSPVEELSGDMKIASIDDYREIKIPVEYQVNQISDNEFNIIDSHGDVIGSVKTTGVTDLQLNGEISKDPERFGFSAINVEGQPMEVAESVDDFIAGHDTTRISRMEWDLDNQYEARAGGMGDSWFDENNNVVIDISDFDGIEDEVRAGNFEAAISLNADNKADVVTVPFVLDEETGRITAVIEADNPIVQVFGSREGGSSGLYANSLEIIQHTGEINKELRSSEVIVHGTLLGSSEIESVHDVVQTYESATLLTINPDKDIEALSTITFGELVAEPAPSSQVASEVASSVSGIASSNVENLVATPSEVIASEVAAGGAANTGDVIVGQVDRGVDVLASSSSPETIEITPTAFLIPSYNQNVMSRVRNRELSVRPGFRPEANRELIIDRWDDRSEQLKADPRARLEIGEQSLWYAKRLKESRGESYLRDVINTAKGVKYDDPENPSQQVDLGVEKIDRQTKAIVMMQVDAEAAARVDDNFDIYTVISRFARQRGEQYEVQVRKPVKTKNRRNRGGTRMVTETRFREVLGDFNLVIHLDYKSRYTNRDPNSEESDDQLNASAQANIAATKEKIAKAQKEFPNLKITVFEKRWDVDNGELDDESNFAEEAKRHAEASVMLALRQAASVVPIGPGSRIEADQDILILNTDMRVQAIDPEYVSDAIKEAEAKPEIDIFAGDVETNPGVYVSNPGFEFADSFRKAFAVRDKEARRRTVGLKSSNNYAVRASTLAAVGGSFGNSERGTGVDENELIYRVAGARSADATTGPTEIYQSVAGTRDLDSVAENIQSGEEAKPVGFMVSTLKTVFIEGDAKRKNEFNNLWQDVDEVAEANRDQAQVKFERSVNMLINNTEHDVAPNVIYRALRDIGLSDSAHYRLTFHVNGRTSFRLTEVGRQKFTEQLEERTKRRSAQREEFRRKRRNVNDDPAKDSEGNDSGMTVGERNAAEAASGYIV